MFRSTEESKKKQCGYFGGGGGGGELAVLSTLGFVGLFGFFLMVEGEGCFAQR